MTLSKQVQPSTESNAELLGPVTPTVWLVLVYLWYFIATPDTRFPFIGEIHFERILVAIIAVMILIFRPPSRPTATITVLLLLFFIWMLICYAISPYKNLPQSTWWFDNYWKLMVFYFFVLFSVRTPRDLFALLAGVAVVIMTYQLHSWYDFLNGGSYVYQQGITRMVGVWSGGGIGAANTYGFLALFTIPFGVFWLDVTQRRSVRIALIVGLFMSFASVFFSGTRGALVVSILLGLVYGRKFLGFKGLLFGAVLCGVLISIMPEGLRHRYFDLIIISDTQVFDTAEEQIAASSARGRIQGLKDGWALALMSPVFGHGPGASPNAKLQLPAYHLADLETDEAEVQLHNLYGQVLSETGFIGGVLFLLMLLTYVTQLRAIKGTENSGEANLVQAARRLLLVLLLVALVYGMFTHNLYRYIWPFLFASQAALVLVARSRLTTLRNPPLAITPSNSSYPSIKS